MSAADARAGVVEVDAIGAWRTIVCCAPATAIAAR